MSGLSLGFHMGDKSGTQSLCQNALQAVTMHPTCFDGYYGSRNGLPLASHGRMA